MTTVYLIRHCETVANETHLLQGSTDHAPSERGKRQLECLKDRFSSVKLDAIYSSTQGRAIKTAEAVRGERDMEIIKEHDLRELECGVFEGTRFVKYLETDPVLSDIWYNKPYLFEPQGGERACDAYKRATNAIKKIVRQNDGKTVAVTSHGFVIRCILANLKYDDITRLADAKIPCNTAITTIEFYDDGTHTIVSADDTEHLPEELCTFFVAK